MIWIKRTWLYYYWKLFKGLSELFRELALFFMEIELDTADDLLAMSGYPRVRRG